MTSPLPKNKIPTNLEDLRNCILTLGLAFAALLSLLYMADDMGSFGTTMVVGIPLYVGAIVGHMGRFSTVSKAMAAGCLLLGALVSIAMWNIAGLLCTTIAGLVLIVPMMLGAFVGHHFHKWQRSRRTDWPSTTTAIVLFLLIVVSLSAESRFTRPAEIETVATTRILEMSRERAWESLIFYEDVGLEPPLLTQIGLPYPLRTEGDVRKLGSVTRCVYSTGYLMKRITVLEPTRKLAFDVIEQHGVEDQSFELISGSFDFESVGDGQTRVVLTTTYRPLLQARFYWRPFEERLTHVLHEYVLDGMSLESEHQNLLAKRLVAR